jgi:cyclic-di-AMP phosphodiesterase PgpH
VAHHGTTLTSYFYQLARRSLRDAGMAEDSGLEHAFRYDGPTPRTREMAILMLADTVEAASRSIEKPTPNRIREMVEGLIREKVLDGQLENCPVTLRDLHEIRESFVFSLSNMLHGRSPYPREDCRSGRRRSGGWRGTWPAGRFRLTRRNRTPRWRWC